MATLDKAEPVGLVGVGNMGAPMARCLAKAGWQVLAYDASPAALGAVEGEDGITLADDAAGVGANCPAVITMLPNGAIVREAVLGRAGIAETMSQGAVLIDMSSSDPLGTRALGAELAKRGIGLVDAPVSGGVPRARTGTLAIMAGGEADAVDRVAPMLAAMGTVMRTGPLGSGHAMKALNNYVSAAGLAAACEALLIGARFGLDPQAITDILNASTGRNNATENKFTQYILSRAFNSGFSLDLMVKDVNAARDLARGLGVPAPELEDVSALLARAAQALGKGADHTAIFSYLESLGEGGKRAGDEAAE